MLMLHKPEFYWFISKLDIILETTKRKEKNYDLVRNQKFN